MIGQARAAEQRQAERQEKRQEAAGNRRRRGLRADSVPRREAVLLRQEAASARRVRQALRRAQAWLRRGVAAGKKSVLRFEVDDSKEAKMNVSAAVLDRVDRFVDWKKGQQKNVKTDKVKVFEREVTYVLDLEDDWVEYERSQEGRGGGS